jgi:hypothetical protein
MKFNEQKRNLILLHENQTELLITFKHDGSERKEKSRKNYRYLLGGGEGEGGKAIER